MEHKHDWKRSPRKHRRPPRFFVCCSTCGLLRQAVVSEGHLRVFHTGRPRAAEPMKNYSIRLPRKPTRAEVKKFQAELSVQKLNSDI